MQGIGSPAPRPNVSGRPKALGSRRSGRAGEPSAGVGKPWRCPAAPAVSLLPAPWPVRSPARSLWVNIKDLWYYFPKENVMFLSGSPRQFRRSFESGRWLESEFCAEKFM